MKNSSKRRLKDKLGRKEEIEMFFFEIKWKKIYEPNSHTLLSLRLYARLSNYHIYEQTLLFSVSNLLFLVPQVSIRPAAENGWNKWNEITFDFLRTCKLKDQHGDQSINFSFSSRKSFELQASRCS